MIQYQLLDPALYAQAVIKYPDRLSIPNDPENADWQAYQAWLAEGNTPLPPEGA